MSIGLPWQKRSPSVFAPILAWWNDRVRAIAPFAHARLSPSPASDAICDARWPDQAPALARYSYDASLLFRRMAALQIDRDELASDDPLLFRELQGLCTLCRSKERCVRDLTWNAMRPSGKAGANIARMPRRSTLSARCKTAAGPHNT